jgi:glycine dehydrogenase subunit 2
MKTLFEKSIPGRTGVEIKKYDDDALNAIPENLRRKSGTGLPELSEFDVVRHYTNLSKKNMSVDANFYPLGSCTMKYNPKVNESAASLPGFADLHPWLAYTSPESAQGALELLYNFSSLMCEITGMKRFTTQPYAGAHGELLGTLLIAAYFRDRGEQRTYVIVPESAHGTNPASAAMAGFSVISIPVDADGGVDIDIFREKMTRDVAAVMFTQPGTLGLFDKNISEISKIAHANGALMYYDGANLNAILGKLRPGDIGFDVIHINLHKTFSTPHGGGGPGSGVVGVSDCLLEYLPVPLVSKLTDGTYVPDFDVKKSICKVASFFGNFGVIVRAYTYILMLGGKGLVNVSEMAVLNANYIMNRLKPYYDLPYDTVCMHECVFSAHRQVKNGVHALDIAKALIDRGFHPPTVYFPLVVEEAIMIEPTETESLETLDEFIDAMIAIAELAESDPEKIISAPVLTEISRPDETKAARELKIVWS